jgi:hypothetical protein
MQRQDSQKIVPAVIPLIHFNGREQALNIVSFLWSRVILNPSVMIVIRQEVIPMLALNVIPVICRITMVLQIQITIRLASLRSATSAIP